jgi:hypothetical protein
MIPGHHGRWGCRFKAVELVVMLLGKQAVSQVEPWSTLCGSATWMQVHTLKITILGLGLHQGFTTYLNPNFPNKGI